jgi:glycerol kinase
MQVQADVLGTPVRRPSVLETTGLGAAYLAGLGEGVWASRDDLREHWRLDREFRPAVDEVDERYALWQEAVRRALAWASD